MNGKEIDTLLTLIEQNAEMTRAEAITYIKKHRETMTEQLACKGETLIRTKSGDIVVRLDAVAA